jgi:hydroxyacylglutathione hydrolase
MRLFPFRVPPLDNAVYVLADVRGDALVIDPSFGEREVLEAVRANGLRVVEILNTHGHFDHTFGDAAVKTATRARLAIHRLDAHRLRENATEGSPFFPMRHPAVEADHLLEEGAERRLADLRLVVLHTPGHTEGSVCFNLPDEGILFSGDTLFNAGLGRVDLPGGDAREMVESLQRLMSLPDETAVYPGHGPATRIGAERAWVEGLSVEALSGG